MKKSTAEKMQWDEVHRRISQVDSIKAKETLVMPNLASALLQ